MGLGRLVIHLGERHSRVSTRCRCRAKDERGNMSKDDDSAHDYYAMDITKAQYVDVNVYPKGTLTPLNKVELPVQFPSL